MTEILKKYKHALLALYIFIYLPLFFLLEKTIVEFTSLNTPVDNAIPFIDIFILPYFAWFFYVVAFCAYFILVSQREFVKLMTALIIGMSSYLIICYIFPNGLTDFRPESLSDSIFSTMASGLYAVDTSTNVFPSIHVYNSIIVHIAVHLTDKIKHKWIKNSSLILCILICLSTIFLKQHALIDVFGGIVMAVIVYKIVYKGKFADFIDRKTWA